MLGLIRRVLRQAVRIESQAPGGRLCLAGGLLLVSLFLAVLFDAYIEKIIRLATTALGARTLAPEWRAHHTIAVFIVIAVYLLLNVTTSAFFYAPQARHRRR